MKIVYILILSCLCVGCATKGEIFRYEDGLRNQMYEIQLNTQGALSYKDKDVEIQVDSRKPTAWERFITPVVSGATSRVQSTAEVK